MIYTCTITPSIDYTTYLPNFKTGKLNRTAEVHYYPGGKGINVSRVLNRLGTASKALGFAGGFTGNYIEEFLNNEGVSTDFIETSDITRINVKIKSEEETELNGPGPVLQEAQLDKLAQKVQSFETGDWFVLAGSLPASVPQAYFLELAAICQSKGVRFVLDTSGPALKELVGAKPFLIKPNEHELGELFGVEITGKQQAISYASKLVRNGIENVIVSMGGEGALLVTANETVAAEAPKGQVVNTVGSGDSLVSGFIASYAAQADAVKAFQYGVACGSATAFRSDLCEKQDAEALLSQVVLHPITEEDVTT